MNAMAHDVNQRNGTSRPKGWLKWLWHVYGWVTWHGMSEDG